MRNIIDIADLTVVEIDELIKTAHQIIAEPASFSTRAAGKILATLFFEPSTRTRLSFESAMLRLGGQVISMPSGQFSSASKGETIADTATVVSNYTDVIAMRHPLDGAALVAARHSRVPVINAGDGGHYHPTQTLADLLTIERQFGRLSGLTIVAVGDLLYGRTVHSLMHALMRYPNNRFIMVSPHELRLPREIVTHVRENGSELIETASLDDCLEAADVMYMTRIQQERFHDPAQYARLKDAYILSADMVAREPEHAIVLHPLPRVNEIAVEVDKDPRARYFEQTYNGMIMRMALLDYVMRDALADPNKEKRSFDLLPADAPRCPNSRCVTHSEYGIKRLSYRWTSPAVSGHVRCGYCDAYLYR
ncbi:MAG: aspartate carbamoyltransferase [Actinomycetaceae bacterium]|nr:aspartate carbamoyltransferase [Actinomycetaceae bacterium]